MAGIPALLHGESPAPPSLGNAASFAVLGGSSVTSTGSTIVTGNLGVSPGNTITGSPTVKIGAIYRNDSIARQAQKDATSAYNDLAVRACPDGFTDPNLGGKTFKPGVYCFSSSAQLTETPLILEADASAPSKPWIFLIKNSLTTVPDSSVVVVNGGHESNVFWQVGQSVTLGASTAFLGNVLALKDITLGSGASVSGRLLARGAVVLAGNNVSLCCDPITLSLATLPNGKVCAVYSNTTFTASGGTGQYTFSVPAGTLPDGLVLIGGTLSGTPTKKGSFNIPVTATDSNGCFGTRVYVIDISCPADDPSPILPPVKACEYSCRQIKPSCGIGPFSVTSGMLPDGLLLSPDGMLCGKPTTPGDYTFTINDSASGCPRRYTLQVICNVMISPPTLPSATACVPYREVLTASCGTAPYTFIASCESLPDGLCLSPTGVVSGTPTTPGPFTFPVTVTDAKSCTVTRSYTVVVNPQGPPPTLPDGVVCTPYRQPITHSCGMPPYTCVLAGGAPPPGLVLTTNCVISGTPTVAGSFSFTVRATNAGGSTITPYTIVITCPTITISPSVLPAATTCQQYSCVKLTPSCAIGSTQFKITAGELPPGLDLSIDGMLCGKPEVAGTYTWTVTFADTVSGCTGSVTYTLPVTGVTITPACLPAAPPGVPYSEMFTASGGTAPYTFILNGTLPPGLTFMQTTPTTATISGTPTMLGCFPFTVTVTDANGCSTSTTCTICVAVGGPTLTGWGMVVLSILLVGVGFLMISKGDLHV